MKKKLLAMSVLAAISSQASAFQFDTSDDWQIRWDNTFKANIMSRVVKADDDVVTPQAGASWSLYDDADLSVDRSGGGLVSTRLDVISELDVIWKESFGFRISGSGWYDPQYKNSNNDHPGDRQLTWASPSADVGDYNHEAKDLHYAGGELLDAFVFANFDIGDTALGVRAGRHTIYWGNGLLFGGAIQGIGGAMAPIDFNKALAVPGSEAKELFMPTGKISTVFQVTDNITLNAYYSYEFQANRTPEDGTYFALAEGLSENSEFITLGPGDPIRAGLQARGFSEDTGDYGFNFQYFFEPWALEASLIYINYTDKNLHGLAGGMEFGPTTLAFGAAGVPPFDELLPAWIGGCSAGLFPCPEPPVIDADAGTATIGRAKWVFKNDIDLFGISLAKEIAGVSVGMDLVYRQDTGIAPELSPSLQQFTNVPGWVTAALGVQNFDFDGADSDNYPGAVGDTMSVVINGLGLLNSQWGLWDGGSWIVEAAFTWLDSCNENCHLMSTKLHEDRVASGVDVRFNPTWYQVRPGWDMTIPMSVSYVIDGETTPQSFGGNEELGNASIGVKVDIEQLWAITFTYTNRFGPVLNGIGGSLKDRDNVALTIKRTW